MKFAVVAATGEVAGCKGQGARGKRQRAEVEAEQRSRGRGSSWVNTMSSCRGNGH